MTQTAPGRLRLSGFSREKAALIRQMEDDGWTGRVSSRGHAIMRSPDGTDVVLGEPQGGQPDQGPGQLRR
jgi:predicted RNA binding protein YcfA (HicA-like mRNA interferase family)